MLLKLIILLLNLNSVSQEKYIGSVERLSSDINNLIEITAKIEILANGFEWSEGPVWSSQLNSVLFSDVPENVIYSWNEDKGLGVFTRPIGYSGKVPNLKKAGTNGLTIDADGNLIICMHGDRKITKLEKLNINKKATLVNSFDGNLLNSPNDLVYDSKGNLYFTDPPYGLLDGDNDKLKEIEFNGVYKVSPNGDIEVLVKNLTRPNGISISNDEKTLYVANSDKNNPVIMQYELSEEGAINPSIFFDGRELTKKDIGLFDGLKVHPTGNIFATGPGGVLVIKENGDHIGTIRTKVRTANCTFDENFEYLYMTSDMFLTRIKLL
ncbi:MAG: SMP-30/gluconolactonase/LRE family protein [Amoebophilaceae bacterium TMED152]|nr:MAG: SMP-30/gluconolactonase/LRE family protein [Amoebophilaceae bacterium TMED152]|tara:strand:+ start:19599 stop:20570 length:972 start_codon:yes stop_codon:yes gene_type:complete